MKSWTEESQKKYLVPNDVEEKIARLKEQKKTIATINGSFDLLHAGHLEMLFQGSLQADILIVALNSDSSIKAYKSLYRPVISLDLRMQMMAAIEFVDFVTYFDEPTPIPLLEKIKPHVHINGSEYGKRCIEADTVEKYGGKVHIVELMPGLSTSAIITKIKQCVS